MSKPEKFFIEDGRGPWNAEATRKSIQDAFGRRQLELAKPCIRSLMDRQLYARFHYQRAQRTLARYVREHLKSEKDFLCMVMGLDDDEWQRFNFVIRKLGADLSACVQSIHAIPDILASTIFFSLQLDKSFEPKSGGFVNHAFVVKCLAERLDLKVVRSELKSVAAGDEFKHLAALSNQSKHYSIIFPELSRDPDLETYLLSFPSFATKRASFPKVYVRDLLPPVHKRVSESIVRTGHALNEVLSTLG